MGNRSACQERSQYATIPRVVAATPQDALDPYKQQLLQYGIQGQAEW